MYLDMYGTYFKRSKRTLTSVHPKETVRTLLRNGRWKKTSGEKKRVGQHVTHRTGPNGRHMLTWGKSKQKRLI